MFQTFIDNVDTRPDRFDRRDKEYEPPLKPVPAEFPSRALAIDLIPRYSSQYILDQGKNSACVGYGLAACINYQRWFNLNFAAAFRRDWANIADELAATTGADETVDQVSPMMLYHLAQLYDEWDGDDYEGSSCRGALRGWHHHGVCRQKNWPDNRAPDDWTHWRSEALGTTVGAYFRVNVQSITDLQAAIYEVHAVFASARIHQGWGEVDSISDVPSIPWEGHEALVGGHSFALVGYDPAGFIVQNSWGSHWGLNGFARITYEDWLANGMDAWVAALGAPRRRGMSPTARSRYPLLGNPELTVASDSNTTDRWTESQSYEHTIVLGNAGLPLSRLVAKRTGKAHLDHVAYQSAYDWLENTESTQRRLLIFALGGLLSERDTLERVASLGPYFLANNIYPIFMTWSGGLLELVENRFKMAERSGEITERPGTSMLPLRKLEARDYTIEVFCSTAMRPIWTEYKTNALSAATGKGGARTLVNHLKKLLRDFPETELHIAAQSVASLLAGHIVEDLSRTRNRPIKIDSLTLFAPACSMEFASRQFGIAIKKGVVSADKVHIEILNDTNEKRDTIIGHYGKSLLYLISRALEVRHKTELLGLDASWNKLYSQWQSGTWEQGRNPTKDWRENVNLHKVRTASVVTAVHVNGNDENSPRDETVAANHRSFLHSVESIGNLIRRVKGNEIVTFEPDDLR